MFREIMTNSDVRRFENKFVKSEGCWIWNAGKSTYGYGWFRPHGQSGSTVNAHRVSYDLYVGEVPEGKILDHLCRNRDCVNPRHLEPVTPSENIVRGTGAGANNRRKTECIRGHKFTDENTYVSSRGFRSCKTCHEMRTGYPVQKQLRSIPNE